MSNRIQRKFSPDYTVNPGKSLAETLDKLGMTQNEVAERTGLSRKTINGIINGSEPITSDTAIQLEKVFRVPARFWINLQKNYEEADARLRERKRLAQYSDWIKEEDIPLKELIKLRVVPFIKDSQEQLIAVLTFFGVASPNEYFQVWKDTQCACNFRVSSNHPVKFGCMAAWLRLGELAASELNCAPFDNSTFMMALTTIRKKLACSIPDFIGDLVQTLAECGVALVFIPGITGAPIFGATRWQSSSKAIVQMSLRGKDDGNFWFTLFHELGHIHLHGKRDVFLELDDGESSEKEREADEFARNRLIPSRAYTDFLHQHGGGQRPRKLILRKDDIVEFARRVQVPPGIVVGRLQHEGWLDYKHCNGLKQRLVFAE